MKHHLLLIAVVVAMVFPSAIHAQVGVDTERAAPPTNAPSEASRDGNRPANDSDASAAQHRRASQVIGMDLLNLQDEKVGKIQDLVIDLSARRVTAVVISSGGFLGIADELSIVPPSALQVNDKGDAFTANFTKEQLTNAPRFQGSAYPDLNDRSFMLNVYSAYQAEPYLESIRTDGTSEDGSARVLRASEILGMTVKNHQDESIGSINELVLNEPLDRVSSVVVSSGGFLGLGETLSVLPAEAVTTTKDAVLVNATKETLQQSPRFTADTWPERMNDPSYLVDVYSPYQFRGDTEGDVDVNSEAKRQETEPLTAQDQSNNVGDVALTTNIRRRIVSNDALSFTAKNIRVITVEGKVTLTGRVPSKEEMDTIVKIANEEAGPDLVTNRLTVEERR